LLCSNRPKADTHINEYASNIIYNNIILSVSSNNDNNIDNYITDLDTHANMVVLGKNCYVTRDTGRIAEVQPFSLEYKALQKVPIIDAIVQYDDRYLGKTYLLVFKNALFVLAMKHNLLPPFLIREAGLIVNDILKSQAVQPTINHHSIFFPEENIRISLLLYSIFSYFLSKCPLN